MTVQSDVQEATAVQETPEQQIARAELIINRLRGALTEANEKVVSAQVDNDILSHNLEQERSVRLNIVEELLRLKQQYEPETLAAEFTADPVEAT